MQLVFPGPCMVLTAQQGTWMQAPNMLALALPSDSYQHAGCQHASKTVLCVPLCAVDEFPFRKGEKLFARFVQSQPV